MPINLQQNVELHQYSTFKVGGPSRYFCEVASIEELHEALKYAKDNSLNLFILAGGSNVIFPDQGYDGLVILMKIHSLQVDKQEITAGAAVMMSELVDASVEASLQGLEWAGGLPGTFGGAIRGNAGAFRGEIKDTIKNVASVEVHSGRLIVRANEDCQFGYRDSIFKHRQEVIVEATVKLKPGNAQELRAIADDRIAFRHNRHPLEYPNAGSIFKNTPLERVPERWLAHFHDFIKVDPFPIIPTGKIIEDAGLKGYQIGHAQVSPKHANYIVNTGTASATDIISLIKHIQAVVAEKFDIELEVEPEIVK